MVSAPSGRRPQLLQRGRNLGRVMNALRAGPASRSELAAALSLDRSTLTHLANALLSAGLIVEADEKSASARGGRRPRSLSLNPGRFTVLGVDIRVRDAEWTLLRLNGQAMAGGSVVRADGPAAADSGQNGGGAAQWLTTVANQTTARVQQFCHDGGCEVRGVGLSVPGLVDRESGTLIRSVAFGVENLPLAPAWSALACPVHVDNDAHCCLRQVIDGPSSPHRHETAILCQIRLHQDPAGRFKPSGAGIGLAFSLGGTVFHGAHGAAGELRGARWSTADTDQLGLRLDLIQATHGRTAAIRELSAEVLRNLSVVASAIDPDRVGLTGDAALLQPAIQDLLAGEMCGTAIAELAGRGLLEVSEPARYPAEGGAALMALSDLFRNSAWQDIISGVERSSG